MSVELAIQKVISVARSEIGYLEKASNSQLDSKTANPGSNNWTKYAAYLDGLGNVYNGKKNGYAWCDVFVDYCFIYPFGFDLGMKCLRQAIKGLGAGCTYSMRYYKEANAFYTSPQAGDQIFFTRDKGSTSYHTGLVVEVKGGRVYTIEGNTSSAAGVVENGGCVRDKSYPLGASYIAGYGRPNWSVVAGYEEPEAEEEEDVVRYKRLSDIPDTWDKQGNPRYTINMLMNAGVLAGDGSDPDGNNDVIDISHDMMRMMITIYRGGGYDRALIASGQDPVYTE